MRSVIVSSFASLVGSHDLLVDGMVHWLSLLLHMMLLLMLLLLDVSVLSGTMSHIPSVSFVLLSGALRGLGRLVEGGWLLVLALKVVIFFNFVLSEGLDSGSAPLLSLAKLLVVILLSGNCFSTSNVISLIVQCLLFSQGVESVVRGVVRGTTAAVMYLG